MITLNDIIKMRTIVDLPKAQIEALEKLCRVQKISRAEAVRRAVDGLLKASEPPATEIGFGLWRDKPLGSRQFVDRLRSEWER
jgi:hypothetical protein